MKRALSLVLALGLVLMLAVPVGAFAGDDYGEDEGSPYAIDIKLMGYDGGKYGELFITLPSTDRGYVRNEIVAAIASLYVPSGQDDWSGADGWYERLVQGLGLSEGVAGAILRLSENGVTELPFGEGMLLLLGTDDGEAVLRPTGQNRVLVTTDEDLLWLTAPEGVALTKQGSGTLVLAGGNSFSDITVNEGGLILLAGSDVGEVEMNHDTWLVGEGNIGRLSLFYNSFGTLVGGGLVGTVYSLSGARLWVDGTTIQTLPGNIFIDEGMGNLVFGGGLEVVREGGRYWLRFVDGDYESGDWEDYNQSNVQVRRQRLAVIAPVEEDSGVQGTSGTGSVGGGQIIVPPGPTGCKCSVWGSSCEDGCACDRSTCPNPNCSDTPPAPVCTCDEYTSDNNYGSCESGCPCDLTTCPNEYCQAMRPM